MGRGWGVLKSLRLFSGAYFSFSNTEAPPSLVLCRKVNDAPLLSRNFIARRTGVRDHRQPILLGL